jgi:(R,R)-butanediol dehydrogenase/meso-butanediol dehydrogenase/diacetyl reductase
MRAAVYHGPHDIRIESVPDPGPPRTGEVILRVARAAICGTDSSEWLHGPHQMRPPVVMGHEFVGRVIAVGSEVDRFAISDRVVSGAGISCGRCTWCLVGRTNLCSSYKTLGFQLPGGLAEYVASPASICRVVPPGCTDDAAAMAQPLAVALHAVRRSGLDTGASGVVIGVGGIGAFIIAGAASRGADPLIAVDIDHDRLATARTLGATDTIDARAGDITALILEMTGGEGADVVIEASGAPNAPAAALTSARRGGRVVLVGMQAAPRELDLRAATVREVDIVTTNAHVCDIDLPESLALLATSSVAYRVLDRVIALESLVDEGIRALAERTARGKIVVNPCGG